MKGILVILLAYILDQLVGDPENFPHPVRLMGACISWFLKKSAYLNKPASVQLFLGLILWLSLVAGSALVTQLIVYGCGFLPSWLDILIQAGLVSTCFSVRNLADEARAVQEKLDREGLDAGRRQVSRIVGRETDQLSRQGVIAAAVETVAENTSDGFVAPLFYATLLGPVGAMAYKAVNTLDSMVGYQDDNYRYIGCVSARMDDLFNWLPARLTWLFMMVVSAVQGLDAGSAVRIGWRDRYQHKSPNAGFPESVMAGALGVELGGGHRYHGRWVEKPTIGDPVRPLETQDIRTSCRLLYGVSLLAVLCSVVCLYAGWRLTGNTYLFVKKLL